MCSGSSYLRALLLSIFAPLLFLALININQDPFIGRQTKSVILNLMHDYIRMTRPDIALIGSSRVTRGFDTCGHENILKLGIPGIKSYESEMLAKHLFEQNHAVKLYIELRPYKDGYQSDEDRNLLKRFFGMNTFIGVINNFYDSLHYGDIEKTVNCSPNGHKPGNFNLEHYKSLYKKEFSEYKTEAFTASINRIHNICIETGNHAEITFFTAPIYPMIASIKEVNEFMSQIQKDWSKLEHAASSICHIEIANYPNSEHLISADRSYWEDANHFKPMLGNQFLRILTGLNFETVPDNE